ncbi:MAG: hypothetical protein R6V77_03580 [Candidatus Cloacimonadaceae bacterium]
MKIEFLSKTRRLIFIVAVTVFNLFLLSFLAAQDSLNTETDLPEITELNYDELEQQNWRLAEPAKEEIYYRPDIRLSTRHNYNPGKNLLTNRLIFKVQDNNQKYYPQFHAIGYQKLQLEKEPVNLAQLALSAETGSFVKQVILGKFRLQAGAGLCLGAYNNSAYQKKSYIQQAPGLSHPALTGFAAHLNFRQIDITSWISQTSRIAVMQNDTIVRLYESSLIITSDKEKILEKTAGLLISFQHQAYQIGVLYYNQSYDYAFAETTDKPVQQAAGIFAGYEKKPFALSGELNLTEDKPAQALHFRYQSKIIRQSLRYYHRPVGQKLPYSKTQQIFGQSAGSRELSWDLSYKPLKKLTLTSRIAAFQDLNNDTDTDWKERFILAAKWRDTDWQGNLTWYRFRKTAVPAYDTLFTELLPTQNRIRTAWSKQISKIIQYEVTCQYQHYLDKAFIRNGLSMQQTISYKTKKLDCEVAFLTWTNQKSVYQPTELLTNEELLIQADSDTAFRTNLRYRISRNFALNLTAYRPNWRVSRQSFSLHLQAAV